MAIKLERCQKLRKAKRSEFHLPEVYPFDFGKVIWKPVQSALPSLDCLVDLLLEMFFSALVLLSSSIQKRTMKSAAIILVIFALEMNIRGATTLNFPGSESSESQSLGLALNSFGMPEESSYVVRAILAFEAGHHDVAVTMARRIAASGNVDAI